MQNEQVGEIRRAMRPVAAVFEELEIPYAVVGSVAGLSFGYSRFTMDIDVVASLPETAVETLVERLSDDYYIEAGEIRTAIRHRRSFNLICNANGWKIDVFVPSLDAWQQSVTTRREPEVMDDNIEPAFYIQSAEDLVLSKLRCFRATNETSERQWGDVLGILKLQQFNLDCEYLEHWAKELKIADLLARALDNAGLKPLEQL